MTGQVNRITSANRGRGVGGGSEPVRTPSRARTASRVRSVPCPNCGGRTRDGHLCKPCVDALHGRLTALPGWWVELQRTVTRQARLSPPGAGRAATKPLPFNAVASEVADRVRHGVTTSDAVRNGLVGWVRITVEELAAPWPNSGVTDLCEHLIEWLPALRKHEAAAEFAADAWGWVDAISGAVDHPDVRARIPSGPCPETGEDGEHCAGVVVAHMPQDPTERAWLECPSCGWQAPSREWGVAAERIEQRQQQKADAERLARQIAGGDKHTQPVYAKPPEWLGPRVFLTVGDAELTYGVPEREIRRALDDELTRYGRRGLTLVDPAQVREWAIVWHARRAQKADA